MTQFPLDSVLPESPADEQVPPSDWSVRDGHVYAYGQFVPGAHRQERVPYRPEIEGFTCQNLRCARVYARPEVALWSRYEHALGRFMYWLSLASDAPARSRCYECEPAGVAP